MNSFVTELNKTTVGEQSEIVGFPDENITILQSQCLKKKIEMVSKYEDKVKELEENNQFGISELVKYKEQWKEREEELESEIERSKEKYNNLSSMSLSEKNEVLEKCAALEEKSYSLASELEKTVLEVKKYKEENEEFEKSIATEKEKNK